MKRVVICLLLVAMLLMTTACAKENRSVTCDGCGTAITVDADSNITDEWILFCKTCEKERFGEDGIVAKK